MKKVKIQNSNKEYVVGKIVCVGRNYSEHAKELGNEVPEFPLIFLKPASNLVYDADEIIYPNYSNEMHHEVELVVLIGKKIKNAAEDEAENAIEGYGVGLDMTLRDLQNQLKAKGHPWTLAKCFDTSAVVSDFVSTEDYKFRKNENISLFKNGKVQQNSSLSRMIHSPKQLVKYISEKMTLEPGDLIFTGTPDGVSKVERGDLLESSISNIGTLTNKII